MLDIKFIRENPDLIAAAANKKRIPFDVQELIALDEKRLALLQEIEAMRTEQNRVSGEISKTGSAGARSETIEAMRKLK